MNEQTNQQTDFANQWITKQAAIDAVHAEFDDCLVWDESGQHTADEVERILTELPSAQPDKTQLSGESTTKDSTFDCISRHDAIDALGEKPLVWDDLSDFDLGKAAQWSDDVDAIKELPPAQPKRIKGKWKRTKANRGYNAEWTCSNCGYTVYAEFCNYHYCSSCGADMRGDENE